MILPIEPKKNSTRTKKWPINKQNIKSIVQNAIHDPR